MDLSSFLVRIHVATLAAIRCAGYGFARQVFSGVVLLALVLACRDQQPARQPPTPPAQFEVSDNCLVPESGLYDPGALRVRDAVVKESLFPKDRAGILLLAFEDPAFELPRLILVRKHGSETSLEVHELLEDPWKLIADELGPIEEGQTNPTAASITAAAAGVQAKKAMNRRLLDSGIEERLVELWRATLQRAQYAESKAQVRTGKADGVVVHFWADGMAGMIHSPKRGSVLAELVDMVHALRSYAAGQSEQPPLSSKLAAVLHRTRSGEPCLEPSTEPP